MVIFREILTDFQDSDGKLDFDLRDRYVAFFQFGYKDKILKPIIINLRMKRMLQKNVFLTRIFETNCRFVRLS